MLGVDSVFRLELAQAFNKNAIQVIEINLERFERKWSLIFLIVEYRV